MKTITVSIYPAVHKYLLSLSTLGFHGNNIEQVAHTLITNEILRMIQSEMLLKAKGAKND